MPGPDPTTPFPDAGHEAIRQWVADNTSGVSDSYFLTDLLFSLLDGALTAVAQAATDAGTLADRVTALEATVTGLQATVAALTPAP